MDRCHKWIRLTLGLLAVLSDPGFGSSIIEGPRNLTVLVGSMARFNCTVSEGWGVLIWLFDGNPRLTLVSDGKFYASPRYSQQNYTNGNLFTSELMITDVQQNDTGQIKCSIQNEEDNMYAYLFVQVNGSLTIKDSNFTIRENQTIKVVCEALGWVPAPYIFWMENNISLNNSMYITNQSPGSNGLYNEESILTLTPMASVNVTCLAAITTLSRPQNATVTVTVYQPAQNEPGNKQDGRVRTIILAVVLSVVGLLLVIFIILLIICCKRRREPNYQKEMNRNLAQNKTTNRNLETMSHDGNENYGYNPEETMYDTVQMRGNATVRPRFYGPNQDANVTPVSEVHYDRQHDEALPSRTTAYPVHPRKTRNVTLV
ncbi:LOW QUALITY PROTEIN: immunoglobulin superfamily member 5 [Sceloporus undulatus]|uniref:LOW QUALITY PROTEIN: immunoglobulin superfamily member 5 n=1 Tax=Sceloporus undulatus TaxID=8520 RepID=UPI001C4C888E|nr:LOW QUALITY PROTEIN: immunoglobulin superfamily member 5 [Sceloporus undulatus]